MSDDEYMSNVDQNDDDEDYRPRLSPPIPATGPALSAKQPKKRGRKPNPNPSVRSAREAARKANHSVIEKKRREKINQALTELRMLVPAEDPATASAGTKDFKLEVLVRTVTHMKTLIGRVNELETSIAAGGMRPSNVFCARCKGERSSPHDHYSPRIELPPVSSLLTGLPSPPSSGSLAVSSSVSDVPSLHLPGSSLSLNLSHASSDDGPTTSSSTEHRFPLHEQAAYSLLHMSARVPRASRRDQPSHGHAETPRSILGMSPFLQQQGHKI